MADSVFAAVFKKCALVLVGAVGAQRLAKHGDHCRADHPSGRNTIRGPVYLRRGANPALASNSRQLQICHGVTRSAIPARSLNE